MQPFQHLERRGSFITALVTGLGFIDCPEAVAFKMVQNEAESVESIVE